MENAELVQDVDIGENGSLIGLDFNSPNWRQFHNNGLCHPSNGWRAASLTSFEKCNQVLNPF